LPIDELFLLLIGILCLYHRAGSTDFDGQLKETIMAERLKLRITGKAGNLIFMTRNGVTYVKRAVKKVPVSPTNNQIIQRQKFGLAMHFLSPIKGLLIETHRTINPRASGMSIAVRKILANAIWGEYPSLKLDFLKIELIQGHVRRPHLELYDSVNPNELYLRWKKQANSSICHPDDELRALLYCPSLQKPWFQVRTTMIRSSKGGVIRIPDEMRGSEIHLWFYYYSPVTVSFSRCLYKCLNAEAKHLGLERLRQVTGSRPMMRLLLLLSLFLIEAIPLKGQFLSPACLRSSPGPVQGQVRQIYTSQVGIREKQANAGAAVEQYLDYVHLSKGNPWCAAFVCWVLGKAGVQNPRTGWSPDLFPAAKVIWKRGDVSIDPHKPRPGTGDVFGIYFPEKGRIAHAGFVD
jgi:hypothetical protein